MIDWNYKQPDARSLKEKKKDMADRMAHVKATNAKSKASGDRMKAKARHGGKNRTSLAERNAFVSWMSRDR